MTMIVIRVIPTSSNVDPVNPANSMFNDNTRKLTIADRLYAYGIVH